MQIILIIASILLFIMCEVAPALVLVKIINERKTKWYHFVLALIILVLLVIGTICVNDSAVNYNKPKAIDVYRNKTTLKITYVDSIPQDTTVVFK